MFGSSHGKAPITYVEPKARVTGRFPSTRPTSTACDDVHFEKKTRARSRIFRSFQNGPRRMKCQKRDTGNRGPGRWKEKISLYSLVQKWCHRSSSRRHRSRRVSLSCTHSPATACAFSALVLLCGLADKGKSNESAPKGPKCRHSRRRVHSA